MNLINLSVFALCLFFKPVLYSLANQRAIQFVPRQVEKNEIEIEIQIKPFKPNNLCILTPLLWGVKCPCQKYGLLEKWSSLKFESMRIQICF